VIFTAGYSILTEGASDSRHSRPDAAVGHQPRAADRPRAEELPTLPERLGQVRLPRVAAGPKHSAVLQRVDAAHRGNGPHRLHANRRQSLPKIRVSVPSTEVCVFVKKLYFVPFRMLWHFDSSNKCQFFDAPGSGSPWLFRNNDINEFNVFVVIWGVVRGWTRALAIK